MDASSDGRAFLSTLGRDARIWNSSTGELIQEFRKDLGGEIYFLRGGNHIIAAEANSLGIWNISSGKRTRTMTTDWDAVQNVDLSPDGRYAVTGGGYPPDPKSEKKDGHGRYDLHIFRLPKEVWPKQTGSSRDRKSVV